MRNPFRYFNSSPEVIRLVVMMYIRYPLSLRQVEDILFERGIDICHETVRFPFKSTTPLQRHSRLADWSVVVRSYGLARGINSAASIMFPVGLVFARRNQRSWCRS